MVQPSSRLWPLALIAAALAFPAWAQEDTEQREPDEVIVAPRQELPLPEKVQDGDQVAPTVTIREEGGLVIEEYRVAGQLRSVRVTNDDGFSYEFIDIDGDGRLERDDKSAGTVAPVFYTLYEWE